MNTSKLRTIEQVKEFLTGTKEISYEGIRREESNEWIERVLFEFKYGKLKRKDKAIIRTYIEHVTGYKSAQISRKIKAYKLTGYVHKKDYKRHSFEKKYNKEDVKLLAQTDNLHQLNGASTKRILEREYTKGEAEYKQIATISVSHIYNLRKTRTYKQVNTYFSKTRASTIPIGERRKPSPDGKPGYVRIDTVHQGDLNGKKGLYHINAVDEVTQWEVVASVEKISESYLVAALKDILEQYPFKIQAFHSDNGSEYINKTVSALLNKLLIQQTKSRARKSNDNALVESKNASVVRKHMGYQHIPQAFADEVNRFYKDYLNPYLNFHKPCFFAVEEQHTNGKIKKTYPYKEVKTPFEKLKSIMNSDSLLKNTMTFEILDGIESEYSDNQFAKRMVTARNKLWMSISNS